MAVQNKIRAWITSSAFLDLLELYRARIPLGGVLTDVLERLEAFSEQWDFRRMARERGTPADDPLQRGSGAARWLTSATGLSEADEERVVEAARRLGLVEGQSPRRSSYECILILGGARLSCKLRPWYAAEVIRAGVHVDKVGLLGAARPVADSERDATDTYAPGAVDEFDLIVAGGKEAFGFDVQSAREERHDDLTNRSLNWVVTRYEATIAWKRIPVIAVSAPSSKPERRANSADTLQFFLDREQPPRGSHVLLVTSQIYVPYVQLEAIRTLAFPRGLSVETIGVPKSKTPPLQGLSSARHYLQEIRSAIQAALRLCQAYPGRTPSRAQENDL